MLGWILTKIHKKPVLLRFSPNQTIVRNHLCCNFISFNNIKSINNCQNINDKNNDNKRGFGEIPPQTRRLNIKIMFSLKNDRMILDSWTSISTQNNLHFNTIFYHRKTTNTKLLRKSLNLVMRDFIFTIFINFILFLNNEIN